jgi:hypothetical protein
METVTVDMLRASNLGLKAKDPRKWRQCVVGVWRRHQSKPAAAELYQTRLLTCPMNRSSPLRPLRPGKSPESRTSAADLLKSIIKRVRRRGRTSIRSGLCGDIPAEVESLDVLHLLPGNILARFLSLRQTVNQLWCKLHYV